MSVAVRAGRRSIPISHADRLVIADGGLTKRDLAEHYARVAEVMVPHVRDRPLAMQVFPRGIDEDGYFLKDAPRHFPAWIATARVPRREGGSVRHVLGNDAGTLVYLAGQNVVTVHAWTSRADRLERPDRLIFDLDPSGQRFSEIRAAARALGDLLRPLGLAPFAMTTGSRGLHVTVPLRRTAEFGAVQRFAADVAALLAASQPARLTTAFRRQERGGRIFIDVARTRYGQHAVAPYAVRALPGAPVATPLRWEELGDRSLGARSWSVATIGDRLAEGGDPWAAIASHARAVGPAARELARLAGARA